MSNLDGEEKWSIHLSKPNSPFLLNYFGHPVHSLSSRRRLSIQQSKPVAWGCKNFPVCLFLYSIPHFFITLLSLLIFLTIPFLYDLFWTKQKHLNPISIYLDAMFLLNSWNHLIQLFLWDTEAQLSERNSIDQNLFIYLFIVCHSL